MGSTTTTLTSSANPSVFGQSVTFTATVAPVSPATGTAGGTVSFTVDSGTPVSVTLSGGTAKWSTSALTVGTHTVTATYAGSSALATSSATLTQTVGQANSVTTLTVPSTGGVGRSFTLTATVAAQAPGYGLPTGTVTFYDGASSLGTGTLASSQATGTSGCTATLTLTGGLTAGTHSLTAVYGGDANFYASTSPVVTDNIEALATSTALATSLNPVLVNQSVTYTATVSTSSNTPAPATGSVLFYDGGNLVATVPLSTPAAGSTAAATAQFTTSYAAAGSHAMTAVYPGDSSHNSSLSSVVTETVSSTKVTPSLSISSSANPSIVAGAVTFTVTVNAGATGALTLDDGTTAIASGSPDATGKFVFTTTTLSAGTHPLTAVYGGDANFNPKTSSVFTQTVLAAAGVTLTSSLNPALVGQAVTFSGSVAPQTGGTAVPTGTVTLWDGSTDLTPAALTLNPSGAYSLTTSSLAIGSQQITAKYSGDSVYGAGYASLSEVVMGSTTTTLTSSANPSVFGQSVTFTATVAPVSPATATAGGTVTFTVDSGTPVSVTLSGGTAKWSTSTLTVGAHTVTATYAGSSALATSSATVTQTVGQANSVTTLTVPSIGGVGRSFTLTATVAAQAPGYGMPTGTVTFYDGASSLGSGTIASSQATGASGCTATLTLAGGLAAGTHSLTAVYGGDANFYASTSPVVTDNIEALATSTALATSLNPVVVNQSVTYTATVSTSSNTSLNTPAPATGSVLFYDGGNLVATVPLSTPAAGSTAAATAQFTTSYATSGAHAMKAVYPGDSNCSGSASRVLTEVVQNVKPSAGPQCQRHVDLGGANRRHGSQRQLDRSELDRRDIGLSHGNGQRHRQCAWRRPGDFRPGELLAGTRPERGSGCWPGDRPLGGDRLEHRGRRLVVRGSQRGCLHVPGVDTGHRHCCRRGGGRQQLPTRRWHGQRRPGRPWRPYGRRQRHCRYQWRQHRWSTACRGDRPSQRYRDAFRR